MSAAVGSVPILYVHNSASIAGGNKMLLTLFDELQESEFRPVSVLPADGPMEHELRRRDIPYVVLDLHQIAHGGRLTSLRLGARIASWMLRQRARLVHANDPRYYRVASVAARCLRVSTVCHLQLPVPASELAWAFAIPPQAAVACSGHLKREVSRLLPSLPASSVMSLPNAVDVTRLTPPIDLPALRERLGLDRRALIVTIVGEVSERKGHRYFLEMAEQVAARHGNAAFLVVGEDIQGQGRYRRAMEEYARALGIAKSVRFLGFRDDALDWMAASDLVTLPSLHEGLPVALVEAHAYGKPAVATDVDGIPEIVEDGVTGFLVPPTDTPALTKAVLALLDDDDLRRRMGAAARARAERLFSARAYAHALQHVYRRLLA